ncbi:MAG: hypothetical protein AB7W16_10420 [Candidatus Obscuribacterales bacterium]
MDFIDGENLADWLESGNRLDEPEAIRLLGHLCRALDHAHEASVLHRDLKPANTLYRLMGNEAAAKEDMEKGQSITAL